MKIINIGRIVTFIITLLSTIPLFINYLIGTAPKNQIIVHIHVWFGLGFFVFAIISMVLQRQIKKKQLK
ncbi:MAG: hypothetical protein JXC36_06390 [Candidatus Atribacteria bacterium]|nr:hypothetical protein [Candidatus Atribacteria bacterium]